MTFHAPSSKFCPTTPFSLTQVFFVCWALFAIASQAISCAWFAYRHVSTVLSSSNHPDETYIIAKPNCGVPGTADAVTASRPGSYMGRTAKATQVVDAGLDWSRRSGFPFIGAGITDEVAALV